MSNNPTAPFNPSSREPGDFVLGQSFFTRLFNSAKSLVSPQLFVMGVDISHWNASVDFNAMKAAGFEYVIIKATEGNNYTDPSFSERWQRALDAGLIVGPYHFFRSNIDGLSQADYHLSIIKPLMLATNKRMIPPANDVETQDGVSISTRTPRITAWQIEVAKEFTRDPLCYSSPYLWQTLTNNMYLDCTGWVAHWTGAASPTWPTGWPTEDRRFWQIGVYPDYSWVPAVPGVTGEVDVNKFFGTLADLNEFIGATELTYEQKVDVLWTAHPELH